MRVGIIDLGTNSVRFDIHLLSANKKTKALHREKLMVRLGQGVFLNGKLDRNAVKRTLEAFNNFRFTAEKFKVDKMVAFATSALRDAEDRDKFINKVEEKTGIKIRLLSGKEEASLISLGVLSNETQAKKKPFALIDIGGGSTEISICKGREVLFSDSFNIGTFRMQQMFLKTSPPRPEKVEEMRRYIRSIVLPRILSDDWPKVDRVLGSSGTIRALAQLAKEKESAKTFERSELADIVHHMIPLTTSELINLPSMEARRVDMILAGAILLEECLYALKAKKVIVTSRSLRDGILAEETQLFKTQSESHISVQLPAFYEKALDLGEDKKYLENAVQFSEDLFYATKSLHKLKPDWCVYLKAATIMRDTGELVSLNKHENHSSYIVKNMNIHATHPWEVELIAELCKHHESNKIDFDDFPFKGKKQLRKSFAILLSILRITDAIDSGTSSRFKLKSTKVLKNKLLLNISDSGVNGLEALRVEQKQTLFQHIFHKQVSLLE